MMPKTHHVFGPTKPSKLALMGLRFVNDPDGNQPADPSVDDPKPGNDPKPKEPAQDPTDWKAEARKWEDRAKANAEKAKQFDDHEEAQKSELEKATARAEKAEAELAARAAADEQRTLREQVAAAKSDASKGIVIPANLLSGTTKDELEASADELIKFRGEQQKPANKASYVIPDEGGKPSIDGKPASPRAGIGTLRDAYEEIERK